MSSGFITNPNFEAWFDPTVHPYIAHNIAPTNEQGGGMNLDPGEIALHPGADADGGLLAVLRWTARCSGVFFLDATFEGRDNWLEATVDVHIIHNDLPLFSGQINRGFGPGSGPSFSSQLQLSVGDTIDFAVGNGGNDFLHDSTGLSATLSTVPEPSMSVIFCGIATCL